MRAIGKLLQAVGSDFVTMQKELDLVNWTRLQTFAPYWQLMRTATPGLADALLPPTQALPKASVKVAFEVRRSSAKESELQVHFLNIGYATKFQREDSVQCSIEIQLRRDNTVPRRPMNG